MIRTSTTQRVSQLSKHIRQCSTTTSNQTPKMANKRVEMLLERNKHFNTPLSPPVLSDVRKKIRGSGVGGLVIRMFHCSCVVPETCR